MKGEASRGPKDGGHFSKQIFKVREDSESTYKGDVECETCGLWGASLKVDRDEDNYVCDKVCRQRWRLREVVKSLEKRKREGDSKEKSSEKSPPPSPGPRNAKRAAAAEHNTCAGDVAMSGTARRSANSSIGAHIGSSANQAHGVQYVGVWYRKTGARSATR